MDEYGLTTAALAARGLGHALIYVGDLLPFMSYQVSPAASGRERRASFSMKERKVRLREHQARGRPGGRRARASHRARRRPRRRAHRRLTPQSASTRSAGSRCKAAVKTAPRRCSPTPSRSSRPAHSRSWPRRSRRISPIRSPTLVLDPATIGIGAGAGCDGQVLVCTDLLGLSRGHQPKFAKRFANLGDAAVDAFSAYVSEVRAGTFPGASQSYKPNAAGAGATGATHVHAAQPSRARVGAVRGRARRSARARSLALISRA